MSTERALVAAFEALLGPVWTLSYVETSWFSATFAGARHAFEIEIGEAAMTDGFAGKIAEADIRIPKGFVADVDVIEVSADTPRRLKIEALTIDA